MEYYWYYRPDEDFPPPNVIHPSEWTPGERLALTCTQTDLPASQQRRLVDEWCEYLPTLTGLRVLWLNSRVPQKLFDAACRIPDLEGLYVKWSGVTALDAVLTPPLLTSFHLGSSASVDSVELLGQLKSLKWLGVENVKRMETLDWVEDLTGLDGLVVEGSTWTTQRVDSVAPIGHLTDLRFLGLANLRARDNSLAPLYTLTKLERLIIAKWWPEEEVERLRSLNPGLS